jgi:hypothetical protein
MDPPAATGPHPPMAAEDGWLLAGVVVAVRRLPEGPASSRTIRAPLQGLIPRSRPGTRTRPLPTSPAARRSRLAAPSTTPAPGSSRPLVSLDCLSGSVVLPPEVSEDSHEDRGRGAGRRRGRLGARGVQEEDEYPEDEGDEYKEEVEYADFGRRRSLPTRGHARTGPCRSHDRGPAPGRGVLGELDDTTGSTPSLDALDRGRQVGGARG